MKKLLAFALLALAGGALRAADVPDLIKHLKDSDSDARRSAAKSLGEAGGQAKDAAPALVAALRDRDRFVRRFAAEALGKIEGDPRITIPALTLALRDGTKEVQQAAAVSLGNLGPNAIPALIGTLNDTETDAAVRARAAESLGKIGPAAKSALPGLIASLGGMAGKGGKKKGPAPNGDVRLEVVTALGEIATSSDKDAIEALRNLATMKGNRDRALKQAAAQAARRAQERKGS